MTNVRSASLMRFMKVCKCFSQALLPRLTAIAAAVSPEAACPIDRELMFGVAKANLEKRSRSLRIVVVTCPRNFGPRIPGKWLGLTFPRKPDGSKLESGRLVE